MSEGTQVSFRDFAGAVMTGNMDAAARVLEQLLELDAAGATGAAQHFQRQSAEQGPPFMMKAMGLRTAVTGGDEAQIRSLLGECFGLADPELSRATAAVRRRFG
jgi:hypothetical protein